MKQIFGPQTLLFLIPLTLSGCLGSDSSRTFSESSAKKQFTIDPNDPFLKYSEAEIVELFSGTSCNSFGSGGAQSLGQIDYTRGLRGRMKSAPPGFESHSEDWFDLNRFDQSDSVIIPGQVVFDKLNVPTRLFNTGFPTLSGALIQNGSGQPLIEFFRIDFDGMIEMSPELFTEKTYEFAAISDDGVILKIDGNTIINDPYVTPPKLMCGTQTVFMSPETPLSFELAYSQGPRYHIALTLLWREVGSGPVEPLCGYNGMPGNTFHEITAAWFDWAQPNSPPSANYEALMNRGWKVIEQENFQMPAGVDLNPCNSSYVQSVFANQ